MKRFTLKKKLFLLVTSLMFLTSQSVWALDYMRLTPVDGWAAYSNESFEALVDVNINSKWGTWFQPDASVNDYDDERIAYIIVKAPSAVPLSQYFVVTPNNTTENPMGIWSSWKIYGGNFEKDGDAVREGEGWTLIDEKKDEALAGNSAGMTFNFDYSGEETFQYFWIEITAAAGYDQNDGDAYMTMAEWGLGSYKDFKAYLDWREANGTSTDEPVFYTYIKSSPGYNGETADNLFDGNASTKWCNNTGNGQPYVIFKASRPMALSYYKLVTGGDTGSYPGRNWKKWKVYGMNADSKEDVTRESEAWVLLDSKEDVPAGAGMNKLAAADKATSYFTASEGVETGFFYFKVEVEEIKDGTTFQMSELALGDQYTVVIDRGPIVKAFEANFDPEVFAQKSLVDGMVSVLEQLGTCEDGGQFVTLMEQADELEAGIKVSQAGYAELQTAYNQALNAIAGGDLSEQAAAYLTAWTGETAIAPGEGYPVGNFAYIKTNRQITGEEAQAEASRINIYIISNAAVPNPIDVTYEWIKGSGGFGGEDDAMLYDGNAKGEGQTKWCTNGVSADSPAWTVFKSSEPIQPTYYGLVTGNDTHSYPGRNWKNWKIWGANFDENPDPETVRGSDAWVLIDEKVNVGEDVLHTDNEFESYVYLSEGCKVPYQYFKIEVSAAVDGNLIQMNEFTFYNTGNLFAYREGFVQEFAEFDPDERPAYKGYKDAYKAKFEELKNTVNAPDVMKIKNELSDLQKQVASSAELYLQYDSVYNEVLSLSITSESLQAWHEGYISENVAPCAKFIRGTHAYIVENLNLDNDAIKAEMTYLQNIISAVEKDLYILLGGHTVGEWGDGFYGNLIDGIALNYKEKQEDPETGEEKEVEVKATKWGGQADENGNTYIIFRTQDKTNPFFYTLTTGNDTGSYSGRNWGTWYIYGANFEGDGDATKDSEGWILIDSKENIGQDRLHPVNAEPSYFGFSTETTEPYTYYKVVVTKAYNGTAIQMNELHFGTPEEFEEIKSDYTAAANDFDADVVAEQALIDKYKEIIPEIEKCANMEALFRVNYRLESLRDSITASAKVYAKYSDDVEAVKQYLEDYKLEESEALATLKSYLDDDLEPNETFVNGSVSTILDDHVLADSIIAEEIEFLESLKKAAVAAGYVAGTDISSLIVNRSFAKAEQVVDADGKNVTGTRQPEGWDGYVYTNETNEAGTMSAAEFCNEQSKFTISQTLKDLKNGFYEVKLNAGFRPNGDIKSLNYTALAFANDTKTYVPVVREGMTDKENAWTGVHADREIYACDVEEAVGDPVVDSLVVGYVIWGVQGTINAILQDRYEISMVAQVTDGTLKLGLKNEGTLVGGDWLGAGNFRLTYLGEEATADAIAAAAACNGARVATLSETYAPGDFNNDVNEFKAAPNFGAAQKEALADAANRTTVDQLVADGNVFEEINGTKAAYYNLCVYMIKVYEKWLNHAGKDTPLDDDIDAVQAGLMEGQYANTAATNAALAELLEKYPDYLELVYENRLTNAEWAEVGEFDYEFTTNSEGNKVNAFFGTMYDDLKDNETILEFEYKSDKPIEGATIQGTTGEVVELGALEATSDFQKLSFDVKELGIKKASDTVLFRIMEKSNGAIVNIRRMRFVEAPSKGGDLNGDGFVDASDIQVILEELAGGAHSDANDLNGDGHVDASDIQVILSIMAGES